MESGSIRTRVGRARGRRTARLLALALCCAPFACERAPSDSWVRAGSTVVTDTVSLRTPSQSITVLGAAISPDFFTDDARPLLGRAVLEADFAPDAADVVLLSHGLWTRLGGSEDLIGAEIEMGDAAPRIVGVMPEDFDVPPGVDIWFPRRTP